MHRSSKHKIGVIEVCEAGLGLNVAFTTAERIVERVMKCFQG